MKSGTRYIFNFRIANFYTFFSGILFTISINLFTTALLTNNLPLCIYKVYSASLALLSSSLSSFAVYVLLEIARTEWITNGSPIDEVIVYEDYIGKGSREMLLWISGGIVLVGIIVAVLMFVL